MGIGVGVRQWQASSYCFSATRDADYVANIRAHLLHALSVDSDYAAAAVSVRYVFNLQS
jgi:hypothetical protein